jgi:hypothetical protein
MVGGSFTCGQTRPAGSVQERYRRPLYLDCLELGGWLVILTYRGQAGLRNMHSALGAALNTGSNKSIREERSRE